MKKTTLAVLSLLILTVSILATWLGTRTYYRVQFFEVARDHYIYREVKHCEEYIATDGTPQEMEISLRMIEGCMISVGMLANELNLEMDQVVFFSKTPEEAYKAAKERAFQRIKDYYHMKSNPGVRGLMPKEIE